MRKSSLVILTILTFFILFILDFERALNLAISFLILWGFIMVLIILFLKKRTL